MKEQWMVLTFKVKPEEKRLIEKRAKEAAMEVSDYVRSAVYTELVLSGDAEAIRLLGTRLRERLIRMMQVHRLTAGIFKGG